MFTGIITDVGTVQLIAKRGDTTIKIATAYDPAAIAIGASISCSGACLTVIAKGGKAGDAWFSVEASAETLSKTTLGGWAVGSKVNLERSLKVGDEIGGHIVSGHVDGVGDIANEHRLELRLATPEERENDLREPHHVGEHVEEAVPGSEDDRGT